MAKVEYKDIKWNSVKSIGGGSTIASNGKCYAVILVDGEMYKGTTAYSSMDEAAAVATKIIKAQLHAVGALGKFTIEVLDGSTPVTLKEANEILKARKSGEPTWH